MGFFCLLVSVAPVVKCVSVCWSPFPERRDPTGAERRVSAERTQRKARRAKK